jgi:hypothetical protein
MLTIAEILIVYLIIGAIMSIFAVDSGEDPGQNVIKHLFIIFFWIKILFDNIHLAYSRRHNSNQKSQLSS